MNITYPRTLLNRLELVTETMRCALEVLAVAAPDWLTAAGVVNADLAARYAKRADFYRLPEGELERARWAEDVGGDGFELLDELRDPHTPRHLAQLPAIAILRRVWTQEYTRDEKGVRFHDPGRRPKGAGRIVSPHDLHARAGAKQEHHWDGYKAHFTETCDTGSPHLIVRAAATPASSDDATQTTAIHHDLAKQGIHPSEHFADTGYGSAKLIVGARTAGIDLVAPVKPSNGRHARTTDTPPTISPSTGTPGRSPVPRARPAPGGSTPSNTANRASTSTSTTSVACGARPKPRAPPRNTDH